MVNVNAVFVMIEYKHVSVLINGNIKKTAGDEMLPCYFGYKFSVQCKKLQSSVSSIAHNQLVKLVNNESERKP